MTNSVIFLIIGSVLSCIITRDYYINKHEAFIQKLNAEALKRENKLQEAIDALVDENYTRTIEIERLSFNNASLVRQLGGLRDPGSSYTHKNKSSGSDSKTDTGTVLSDEATEFLLELTRDADAVREQLRLCQEWAKSVSKP